MEDNLTRDMGAREGFTQSGRVQGRSPAVTVSPDLYEFLENFYKTFLSWVEDNLTRDMGAREGFTQSGRVQGRSPAYAASLTSMKF